MTKQEKREKAIEEMAQLGSVVCKGADCSLCTHCLHYERAKAIYDAGYRKADEVEKQIAKKIFEELRCHCMTSTTENCYGEVVIPKSYTWWEDDLNKLEKQFGVEVEE